MKVARKLTPAESTRFRERMQGYLDKGRSLASLAGVLGCHRNTARRLLSPEGPSIRKEYADRMAKKLGVPAGDLYRERSLETSNGLASVISSWQAASNQPARREVAYRFGRYIAEYAILSGKPVRTTMTYSSLANHEPEEITVQVEPVDGRAPITLQIIFNHVSRNTVQVTRFEGGKANYSGPLDQVVLRKLLSKVLS